MNRGAERNDLKAKVEEQARQADLWKDRESATQAKYEDICYKLSIAVDMITEIDRVTQIEDDPVKRLGIIHNICANPPSETKGEEP